MLGGADAARMTPHGPRMIVHVPSPFCDGRGRSLCRGRLLATVYGSLLLLRTALGWERSVCFWVEPEDKACLGLGTERDALPGGGCCTAEEGEEGGG